MAIDIIRAKGAHRDTTPATIGEPDADVFSCPACARPLVAGARRCPGCRTHLVMGIQLGRAALFMALGIALGGLVGGGAVAVTVQGQLAAAVAGTAEAVPVARQAAVVPPVTEPIPSVPNVPDQVLRPAAAWSLGQTAEVNARLAAMTPVLAAAAAGSVDTAAVVAALRAIVSDSASGADLSERLGAWPAASGLSADLGQFYADARAAAKRGLAASMSNTAAYRAAAIEVLGILGSLSALDARSRALAETAGIALVPVAVPSATDAAGPNGPGSEPLP